MTADDFFVRLKAGLPKTWFPDSSPYTDAALYGAATLLNSFYTLYAYAKDQLRLTTMSGGWMDLFAGDFFGSNLPRLPGETDAAYLVRIRINLFRERSTVAAVSSVLSDVTGQKPKIFEPWQPSQTGSYRNGGCGYGVAGAYGSVIMRNQALITAYRPSSSHTPVTDDEIYGAINSVKPAGTVLWTQIQDAP